MKKFKPVILYIDDNTYIDVEFFEQYRELAKKWIWHQQGLAGIMLEIGKSFFVFDIDSCEFFERGE